MKTGRKYLDKKDETEGRIMCVDIRTVEER